MKDGAEAFKVGCEDSDTNDDDIGAEVVRESTIAVHALVEDGPNTGGSGGHFMLDTAESTPGIEAEGVEEDVAGAIGTDTVEGHTVINDVDLEEFKILFEISEDVGVEESSLCLFCG